MCVRWLCGLSIRFGGGKNASYAVFHQAKSTTKKVAVRIAVESFAGTYEVFPSSWDRTVKITAIECHVVAAPGLQCDACTSAQDDVVVRVHADEGITGIGEVDTNPWMAKATIESPGSHCMSGTVKEMLIGKDPMNP